MKENAGTTTNSECWTVSLSDEQYNVVANPRVATDGMLWQTPVLSLTAQAFLFSIALGPAVAPGARFVAACLALLASVAPIQLMAKHRYFEGRASHMLEEYEAASKDDGFRIVHGRPCDPNMAWYNRISSYRLWIPVLATFGVAAVVVMIGGVASWEWLLGSST